LNLTLSSYVSGCKGLHKIAFYGVNHFNKLLFSKFVVSKSFDSLVFSKNWNKSLIRTPNIELYESKFSKFYSPALYIDSSSSNTANYEIKASSFHDFTSGAQGSALSISNNNVVVTVSYCSFKNCKSTGIGNSNIRPHGDAAGGACFLSVSESNVFKCTFDSCVGARMGSTICASTTLGHPSSYDCLADINCGNTDQSTSQAIYVFDGSNSIIRNINSTKSISQNSCGTVHVGMYPYFYSMMYVCLIYDDDFGKTAIGSTINNASSVCHASHVYIKNIKNSNGIFSLWYGTQEFDNFVFEECSGNLYSLKATISMITFKNTSFGSINKMDAVYDDSCDSESKSTIMAFKCVYEYKSVITIKCKNFHNLYVVLYMSFVLNS